MRNKDISGSKPDRGNSIFSITGKLLSAAACFAICLLAGFPYLGESRMLHIIATLISSIFLFWALYGYRTRKSEINRLEQFLWLLEYLGSRLSVGHTLENSLLNAAGALESQMGSHRDLHKALSRLRKNLNARLDLDRSLQQFNYHFNCFHAGRTLLLLSNLRIHGGRIETFISSSRQMLQEQMNIQRDVEAEQSQKYSETAVLSILPFCLAYLLILGNSQYSEALTYVNWALTAQTAIFAVSVIAAVMAIRIMSPDAIPKTSRNGIRGDAKKYIKSVQTDSFNVLIGKIAVVLKPFYIHILPWSIGIRFTRQLRYSYPFREDAWSCYISDKIKIAILALASGLPLVFIQPKLWYLLPLIMIIPVLYQDRRLFEKSQMLKRQERLQFPSLLNTISLLLGSGLTLQRALELTLSVWLKPDNVYSTAFSGRIALPAAIKDPFQLDLLTIGRQLESGMPAARALSELSERSSVSQIQAALQLIIRYDSDGGNELLQMIQMQSAACWQVQKNALRKKLEKQSLLLHLPMGLDLIAVLSTAILPAMASLQSSY
jgi:Flp pilus assembly protein TadB